MIAYFTASIVGKKQYQAQYEKIISSLSSHGCNVLSDHIMKTTPEEIVSEDKAKRLSYQHQQEQAMNSCDFVVAETSFPSTSVGYEISMALHKGKPVLILYFEDTPPSLLAQHSDERLVCERYTFQNLDTMIDDFINYIKGITDTRFTFFISADMSSYLEKMSNLRMVPKAVYVRRLIREDMDHQS